MRTVAVSESRTTSSTGEAVKLGCIDLRRFEDCNVTISGLACGTATSLPYPATTAGARDEHL